MVVVDKKIIIIFVDEIKVLKDEKGNVVKEVEKFRK